MKVNIYLSLSAGFGFGVVGGVGAPASIVVSMRARGRTVIHPSIIKVRTKEERI